MKTAKIIKYSFLVSLITLTYFGFLGNAVFAQTPSAKTPWLNTALDGGLDQTGEIAYVTKKPQDIRMIIINIIQIILGLVGVILVIIILIAGFRWMTAGGNEERVTMAKKTLASATIGLLITLSSFAITIFLTGRAIRVTTNKNPDFRIYDPDL